MNDHWFSNYDWDENGNLVPVEPECGEIEGVAREVAGRIVGAIGSFFLCIIDALCCDDQDGA